MSAPDSDPQRQARRHRGPLQGMFAVVLFALLLLAGLAIWTFSRGEEPGTGGGGPSANVEAGDDAGTAESDPSAVTVPSETVTAPQSGQTTVINPTTAPTLAAEPPEDDPAVDEEGAAGGAGATEPETETEPESE